MKALLTIPLLYAALFAHAQIEVLKMKAGNGKIIVKAELNGKKDFFLIDTGSDVSIINNNELKKHDLEAKKIYRGGQAVGFDGSKQQLERVANASLIIGESLYYDEFYSMDISTLVDRIEEKTGIEVTGILGADVLKSFNCMIDYQNREIAFSSNKSRHLATR